MIKTYAQGYTPPRNNTPTEAPFNWQVNKKTIGEEVAVRSVMRLKAIQRSPRAKPTGLGTFRWFPPSPFGFPPRGPCISNSATVSNRLERFYLNSQLPPRVVVPAMFPRPDKSPDKYYFESRSKVPCTIAQVEQGAPASARPLSRFTLWKSFYKTLNLNTKERKLNGEK